MRTMACLLVLSLLSIIVEERNLSAATYRWEDAKGGVNFTDNPDSIPSQYRNRAKKIKIDEFVAPEEPTAETPAQQETAGAVELAPEQQSAGQEKGQEYWQTRYSALRDEMKKIRDEFPAKKQQMSEFRHKWLVTQKRSERQSLNQMEDEIAKDEERIKELERQLELLDVEAARNAVPFEWRK